MLHQECAVPTASRCQPPGVAMPCLASSVPCLVKRLVPYMPLPCQAPGAARPMPPSRSHLLCQAHGHASLQLAQPLHGRKGVCVRVAVGTPGGKQQSRWGPVCTQREEPFHVSDSNYLSGKRSRDNSTVLTRATCQAARPPGSLLQLALNITGGLQPAPCTLLATTRSQPLAPTRNFRIWGRRVQLCLAHGPRLSGYSHVPHVPPQLLKYVDRLPAAGVGHALELLRSWDRDFTALPAYSMARLGSGAGVRTTGEEEQGKADHRHIDTIQSKSGLNPSRRLPCS